MRELYRCMMKVLFCFSVAIIVGFASTVSAQLINNGDGTLTQSRVDGKILMWLQSGGPVILGWDSAMNWVSNLNAAGYTDWRMPTLDELQVLYNEERTLDNYFQNMSDYYYFTSTKYPGHNEWAYCIILAGNRAGVVSYSTLPDVSHAVLPVRDVAANQRPTITSFIATPSNGTAPLNVTFTVAASDPDGTIASVKWDFDGNGTVDETTSGLTTSFTYATSGTFTPIVTVIDNGGSTASATTGLTIQNPAQYTQAQVDQIVNQAVADAVRAKDIIIEQRDLTITNLNLDLNTCASQNTALSGQVSTLTANNTALSGQVSTLTAQNTALSGQVSTLTAQNTALSDQINGLTAELDNAKAKLLAAEQEIANLTHSLQSAFSDPQFFIPGSNAEKQMNNLVSAIVNLNYGQRQALYFNLGGTAGKGKTK